MAKATLVVSFGVSEMRSVILFVLAAAATLFLPFDAIAQNAGDIGSVLGRTRTNIQPLITLIVAMAYLVGFILIFNGLMKLKESEGQTKSYADGGMRIFAGALFVALPSTIGVGIGTLFGDGSTGIYQSTGVGAGQVQQCLFSGGQTDTLSCMINNIKINVLPVGMDVVYLLVVLWGLYLVFSSLYKMAKMQAQGGGQEARGWLGGFVIGIILVNLPRLMVAIQETLGITSGVISSSGFVGVGSSLLSYRGSETVGVLAQYSSLVSGVMAILPLFGVIAVVRGMAIIKAYSDGGSKEKSLGSGLTHIFGGVMLANAKWTICVVLNTLVGGGEITGFCG